MGPSLINASELFVRGLRQEFLNTYEPQKVAQMAKLSRVMSLGLPSDKFSEIYGYYESAPHIKRWPYGESRPESSFKAKNFTVPNLDWAVSMSFHANALADDQSKGLIARVKDAATNALLLPERVFFQFLLGNTDVDLYPTAQIPNAPDGVGFFSSTDGTGAVRFGATSGNLLTGSTVATTANVQTDFFRAISQFALFQDTQGHPLHSPELIEQGVVILAGAQNQQVFRQAFQQTAIQGSSAAPTNVIIDSGQKVELFLTPRITTNDWFVFLTGTATKAVFEQVREPLKDNLEDFQNSDYVRRTKIQNYMWHGRFGHGLSLPYQAIKIDN